MTQMNQTHTANKYDFRRVANHQIETLISSEKTFYNYNNTIVAERHPEMPEMYSVFHWNTKILTYNLTTKTIGELHYKFISTTTSILVGRILRALPRESVERWLKEHGEISTYNKRRLVKMLGW